MFPQSLSLSVLWLLALSNFATASGAVQHYDGFQLLRVIPQTLEQLAALRNFSEHVGLQPNSGAEVWNFRPFVGQPSEFFAAPDNVKRVTDFFDDNQIPNGVLVENFGIQLREAQRKFILHDPAERIRSPSDFDLNRFHPFESIESYLRLLAQSHPNFIKFDSIGKTSEGREIPFLTLGYPSKTSKKPALLLDAGIHAREWIAPAIALHFINALINEPKFHSLLSDIDVHVLPSLNPDGYAHTWTKDRLWRRTRSGPIKSNSKVCGSDDSDEEEFCYGVDPNRNFPFHWGQAGVSKCPCSQVYNGERPLSEPECANLAKFISANTGTIKAYLTLHAYSNLIIHPYGFERHFYPENVAEILRVANSMAKAIVQAGGEKFRVGSAPDILYMVSGSSDDFARSAGIKYTYTMELTSGWYGDRYVGFVYPEEGISKEAEQVLPAFLILAEQVKSESNGKEAEDQKGIGGQ